jgi:hypothetical protein
MSAVLASIFTDFWNEQLVSDNRQGLFMVLVGFVGSFGFIRMSARIMRSPRISWWPGSVISDSGVHLHHLVWGIVTMMAAGTLAITVWDSPWWELSCLAFGIGIGLTIDEFALWVHLDDVYWSTEGRTSIDATVVAAAAMGLVLLGADPFADLSFRGTLGEVAATIAVLVLWLSTVGISFAKRRMLHGVVGFFFAPVAIYAACRIGKPDSMWARRFYGERNPRKQIKAEERFRPDRRTVRFKETFRDAVGGSTTEVYEAKLAARESEAAATGDAAAAVRARAESVVEADAADAERREASTRS